MRTTTDCPNCEGWGVTPDCHTCDLCQGLGEIPTYRYCATCGNLESETHYAKHCCTGDNMLEA